MEISELTAFIKVAELGSFSLASEQLFLTQPAISKRIASLEDQLNARLFDRLGRQVLLTETGQILLPQAKQILQAIHEAKSSVTANQESVNGELRMATSHHIGLHRLPDTLKRYQEQFPDVTIEIDFTQSEEAYQQVRKGEAELAVITLSDTQDEQIESISIWSDPLMCVVSQDHPLAHMKEIKLHQLARYPCVLPHKNTFTRQMVDHVLGAKQLKPKVRMSTNNFDTLTMLVSIGWGWSFLPSTLVNDKLAVLNTNELTLERQLGVIYHKQRTLSRSASMMIKMLGNL
ncbi:LysR family transcriptional regulator [Marinomonas agarivorans]|nr:LysR family transcriptional regulator [Marinomonas agarivorans]